MTTRYNRQEQFEIIREALENYSDTWDRSMDDDYEKLWDDICTIMAWWEDDINALDTGYPLHKCETCGKSTIDCLKHFEVSSYLDTHLVITHLKDYPLSTDINKSIELAKKDGADFIDVFQGCNRDNLIMTLRLK